MSEQKYRNDKINRVSSQTVRSAQDARGRNAAQGRVSYDGMYVEGNTVRRVAEPVQAPRPKRREVKVSSAYVRRNREKVQKIGIPYLMMLVAATVMVLFICVNYLQVQSSITAHKNTIEHLETSLQTMKSDNSAMEARIETYLDLDHIYEVATEELGMQYPSEEQVIYYEKTESGYVRQYEDIPTD